MSKRINAATATQGQHSKKSKTQQSSLSGFFAAKSSSGETTSTATSSEGFKIFCDLDGVLVDFDAGVKNIFNGRSPEELPNPGMMWGGISKADRFYAQLPWTSDGKSLWEELQQLPRTPSILTGVPRANKSRAEKFAWCTRELSHPGTSCNHVDMAGKKGAHDLVSGRRKNKAGIVNVITCWSKNKHCESKENHILIDDRLSLKEAWEGRGGIFIHHTSTKRTLAMLRENGVLEEEAINQNQAD